MGCDYYIVKELRIQHENGVEYVEVSRKGRWFGYEDMPQDWDSDDDSEENRRKLDKYLYEKYIERETERDYTRTIFADGKFVTEDYSQRWKVYLVNEEFQFPERSYPEKYSNDLDKVIRATLIRRVEERTFLNV